MTLSSLSSDAIVQQFELLKSITRAQNGQVMRVDLTKLEKMLHEQLPEELEQLAPPNFPELYFDFKAEYEKMRDFMLYEPLIGKHIVALGGGFSSGKSTFLNTLLDTKVLPAKIDPSTSVPTYIVAGEETKVQGINVFETKMDLALEDLKVIAHGFGRIADDEDEVVSDEITLGHILKNLFLQMPSQTFENIAFLDTPGYSKADVATYSTKTDEKIARAQLNTADYILWFVPADAGTITEQDIHFIKTLYEEIPLCIIVNKADKKTDSDLALIVDNIKQVLDLKGIRYTNVLTFSRKKHQDYDKPHILSQLAQWNQAVHEESFAYNFKKLFVSCQEYYEAQISEENRRLNRLNKALTLAEDEIQDYLMSLVTEIKMRVQLLKETLKKLKTVQDNFFTELKIVADQIGIRMPEPEEIDLLQDKAQDAHKIVQAYKQKHHIKENYDIEAILRTTFTATVPKFFEQPGQKHYANVLAEVLEKELNVAPEDVKFHEYLNRSEGMQYIVTDNLTSKDRQYFKQQGQGRYTEELEDVVKEKLTNTDSSFNDYLERSTTFKEELGQLQSTEHAFFKQQGQGRYTEELEGVVKEKLTNTDSSFNDYLERSPQFKELANIFKK